MWSLEPVNASIQFQPLAARFTLG